MKLFDSKTNVHNKAPPDGRVKPGQLVLMEGVGGGFTWGAVLLRM